MKINQKKTNKYQFSTRLTLEDEILETVSEPKLLGKIFSNDLKWDKNVANIVKISVFGAKHDEMKNIFILYIRSLI